MEKIWFSDYRDKAVLSDQRCRLEVAAQRCACDGLVPATKAGSLDALTLAPPPAVEQHRRSLLGPAVLSLRSQQE